ncbi:hypothetical protein N0V93_003424 [Gnomoniopsis smithogilvyi]|uniref:Threonylcarbamoyl-AMP synthase n=1 Tax=Gnomoniopsis smithogilvyi TaxID=1191159 RepID=A0A9W8Z0E4_9PEZI|nr:hypothetical protein N0V93_003424 [Gnomoniopsis smithogilvyi]
MKTRILKVPPGPDTGFFTASTTGHALDSWAISTAPPAQPGLAPLREAAALLRTSDIPVAFPTETVYGLGADATRSGAVKGIYAAKGRPSDNPLIVHVCDLTMLRGLLRGAEQTQESDEAELIPEIYRELVKRFWPGPLTILLRCPTPSPLASEVTATLPTFGARMPASPLARSLIALTGRPLAAPSANASTKPSPTAASHVLDDLDGRIELILDGGPCDVGVESTVVDGLCEDGGPPVVLRPGGVSLEELRSIRGWEGCVKGYRDESEEGKVSGPRAPGMKYKHYSPKARVVLFEKGEGNVLEELKTMEGRKAVVGIVRTLRWERLSGQNLAKEDAGLEDEFATNGEATLGYEISTSVIEGSRVLDIGLGRETKSVAQGLFSALRELDRKGADIIFVEGVEDRDDIAAAVMNRLRKAASEIRA